MALKLSVDFNSMMTDEQERVFIVRVGKEDTKIRDPDHHAKLLRPGLSVVLYDEEMEVEAVVELVEFRDDYKAWLGRPNWSTRRDFRDG